MDASPALPDMPLLTPSPLLLVAYEEREAWPSPRCVSTSSSVLPPENCLWEMGCFFLQISNHVDLSLNGWYKQDPN